MREIELVASVRRIAAGEGALFFKVPEWIPRCPECGHKMPGMFADPGFPDLVVAGPNGIRFRELKTEAGALTPVQRRWGACIERAGGDWAVWRPRDLANGIIRRHIEWITHC